MASWTQRPPGTQSRSAATSATRCRLRSQRWHRSPAAPDTVLTGLLDRSALYGVLAEVEALGLDLVEVRKLRPPCKSQKSCDGRSP